MSLAASCAMVSQRGTARTSCYNVTARIDEGAEMTGGVALLRAINVGGRNMIAMTELRAMFEALGFADIRTLLQSGNVVFAGKGRIGPAFETRLEAAIAERFKLSIDLLARSAEAWKAVVQRNPFPGQAKNDPQRLAVVFLKSEASPDRVAALRAAIKGREIIAASGRELFIIFPDGIGTSKLTPSLIERELETRGTARNWNTVLKLKAMLEKEANSE